MQISRGLYILYLGENIGDSADYNTENVILSELDTETLGLFNGRLHYLSALQPGGCVVMAAVIEKQLGQFRSLSVLYVTKILTTSDVYAWGQILK